MTRTGGQVQRPEAHGKSRQFGKAQSLSSEAYVFGAGLRPHMWVLGESDMMAVCRSYIFERFNELQCRRDQEAER